jgi:uncharacterized membrane protein
MTLPAHTSPKRVVFVDALRVFAAVQMIQGHTIDALLAPPYRSGAIFEGWTFSRGLTSTTFLFAAGLSFVLASAGAKDPALARRRRVRRGLELFAIGYLMHAPVAVLFGSDVGTAMAEALSVDVLQCIGVSLLLMELVAFLFASTRARALAALSLGLLLLFSAIFCEKLVPAGPSFAFTSYVSVRGGSLFPLVPFGAVVMLGLAVGLWLFHDGGHRAPVRLLSLGALATPLGYLLTRLLPALDPRVSPGHLLLKLGLVALLGALFARLCSRVSRLWPWLSALSSETLFLYVSHVWLLYAAHVGARARWGSTLSPGQALLAALVLLVFCSLGAFGYRRAERALRRTLGGGR